VRNTFGTVGLYIRVFPAQECSQIQHGVKARFGDVGAVLVISGQCNREKEGPAVVGEGSTGADCVPDLSGFIVGGSWFSWHLDSLPGVSCCCCCGFC
jgi:hypothetical protein